MRRCSWKDNAGAEQENRIRGRRRREKGSIFGVSEVNAGGRQSEDSWLDQGVEVLGDGLWMWGLFFTASVWERKKDKN